MRTCWRYDPRERPSFHQIVRHLKDFTSETFREVRFFLIVIKRIFFINNLTDFTD